MNIKTINIFDRNPGPHFFSKSVDFYNGKVPFIVTDLITQLDLINAEKIEGIFRISPEARLLNGLCIRLDEGRVRDWTDCQMVEILSNTFKKYIRTMSEFGDPLFTKEMTLELKETIRSANFGANDNGRIDKVENSESHENNDINSNNNNNNNINNEGDINKEKNRSFGIKINNLLKRENISNSRRNTISTIFKYLRRIADNEEHNKMNPYNISVCIAVNFFANDDMEFELNKTIVEKMIENFDIIFEKNWYFDRNAIHGDDFSESDFVMTDEDIEMIAIPRVLVEIAEVEKRRREKMKGSAIKYSKISEKSLAYRKRPEREAPSAPAAA